MADESNGRQAQQSPPYLPYRTFKNYIEGLQATKLPGRIDRRLLSTRSGSEQSMLIGALQFLGLITIGGDNPGEPTPALEQLVSATGEAREKVLRDLLTMRYPFMIANKIKLESATPSIMTDAFTELGVGGETARKAVAFFIAAAQDAKIPLSSFLKVHAPRGSGGKRRRSNGSPGAPAPEAPQHRSSSPKNEYQTLIGILNPTKMTDDERKAVWTLIEYLKKQEAEPSA